MSLDLNQNDLSHVVAADRAHVWHHLSQHKPYENADPRVFVEGKGMRLWDTNGREYLDAVSGGVWIIVLGLILWLSVWPFLNWLVASYTVTNRRLITRYGVITRRGHDIPLSRISDVAYEKHLLDRLLGCGTLVISDASTNGQVPLHDIPRVEERQRVLNDLLHSLHDGIPGNEGI